MFPSTCLVHLQAQCFKAGRCISLCTTPPVLSGLITDQVVDFFLKGQKESSQNYPSSQMLFFILTYLVKPPII